MDFELPEWIHEHEAMQEVIKEVTRLTILYETLPHDTECQPLITS